MNQNQVMVTLKNLKTPIENVLKMNSEDMVLASTLFEFLEYNSSNYSRWCDRNFVKRKDKIKNIDYKEAVELSQKMYNGFGVQPNPKKEYWISIDLAKHLSMQRRNSKGEIARIYFLNCEKMLNCMTSILEGVVA